MVISLNKLIMINTICPLKSKYILKNINIMIRMKSYSMLVILQYLVPIQYKTTLPLILFWHDFFNPYPASSWPLFVVHVFLYVGLPKTIFQVRVFVIIPKPLEQKLGRNIPLPPPKSHRIFFASKTLRPNKLNPTFIIWTQKKLGGGFNPIEKY